MQRCRTWLQGRNEAFLERTRQYGASKNWAKLLRAFDAALAKVWLPYHALQLTSKA
jgi:hypothetical protein